MCLCKTLNSWLLHEIRLFTQIGRRHSSPDGALALGPRLIALGRAGGEIIQKIGHLVGIG